MVEITRESLQQLKEQFYEELPWRDFFFPLTAMSVFKILKHEDRFLSFHFWRKKH